MEPIITEQIEKFQSGDFSGYESFYYATSQTVYTMLHTIIPDENTAAELMPKVYEKIYANVQTLPQTEAFYAWSAKLANEEALEYLKGNAVSIGNSDMQPDTDSVNAQTMESADSSSDMPFYDYAAEDEALAITEDLSEDRVFTEHVQAVIEALSPMEKVVLLFWRERTCDRRKNGMYNAGGKAYHRTDTDSLAFCNHRVWTGTCICGTAGEVA